MKLNVLLCFLIVQLTLVSAGFDFFKSKNKKAAEDKVAPTLVELDSSDDDKELSEPKEPTVRRNTDRLDRVLSTLQAVKNQQMDRQTKRPDLDRIREASREQRRIESENPGLLNRARFSSKQPEGDNNVQGRGGKWWGRKNKEPVTQAPRDNDDDDEEEYEDEESYEYEEEDEHEDESNDLASRFESENIREQLAAKYVSTQKQQADGDSKKSRINFGRVAVVANKSQGFKNLISGEIKKNKLVTSSYWQNKLNKAFKKTKKGIIESANFVSELPKRVERGMDWVNAILQLDTRGQVLALINEVNEDARFVRKEFSQFTLSWSPIMEKALNYLGDKDLDKLKWVEKDELDHRRDALHSLAFGYEFMRMMIAWREQLLVAHEAFKEWLLEVKKDVERKTKEPDENLVAQLQATHTYYLLDSWEIIEKAINEARTKLDYLMEIEDDRPKNYESEYFRNIVVLQEMYLPTVEEFDNERNQVVNSISESGMPVNNLKIVDDFLKRFRNSLASYKINDIDWEVPEELNDFMNKLMPQLRCSSLVYTRAFLKELGLK